MTALSDRRNGTKVFSTRMEIPSQQTTIISYTYFKRHRRHFPRHSQWDLVQQRRRGSCLHHQPPRRILQQHTQSHPRRQRLSPGALTLANADADVSHDDKPNCLIKIHYRTCPVSPLSWSVSRENSADEFAGRGDWSLVAQCNGRRVLACRRT